MVRRLHPRFRIATALLATIAAVPLIALTAPAASASGWYTPADPQASAATASELNYLGNLPGTGQVLSGFFAGYSNVGTFGGYQEVADLFHATGQYPDLVECDYSGFGAPASPAYVGTSDCDGFLENYWQQGGLVEVGFHPNNPAGTGFTTGMTQDQIADLGNSGTTIYANWQDQLNQVASALNQLGAHGVTVIFRPLMEMNQTGRSWFWWNGGDWTASDYVAVWQNMFNTITSQLTYHNVLWDWSADQGGDANPAAYYPGAAYVDITGLDVYASDVEDYPTAPITNYANVQEPGKPFGFSEIGKSSGLPYDFSDWPTTIESNYPNASFFLSWNSSYGPLDSDSYGGRALMTAAPDINLGLGLVAGFAGGSTDDWGDWTSQPGAMSDAWSVSPGDGNDWADQSGYALKADIDGLGVGQQAILYDYQADLDLSSESELSATVNVAWWNWPTTGMTAELYVRTGSDRIWYNAPAVPITYSPWGTTLTMSLNGIPNLNDVSELGVDFIPTTIATNGAVYADAVTVSP
jgi:mannan endo-1,4-beta-mannosidase